jgi:hypothetical protein
VDALEIQKKTGITGSTIKMIAIITMLVDHTAATVLERYIVQRNGGFVLNLDAMEPVAVVYIIMRLIGRLAFPIFIFLLVEGLEHTRNQWKYLFRMLIFAFVSEIPFDLAFNLDKEQIFSGRFIELSYQNVFFTLTIGLAAIIGIKSVQTTRWRYGIKVLANIGITGIGMGLGYLLRTDYGAIGVLAIVMMYLLRSQNMLATAMTCVVLMFSSYLEISSFLILLPIKHYNGERGWKLKWVFYVFYPAHLLILWLICLMLGLA